MTSTVQLSEWVRVLWLLIYPSAWLGPGYSLSASWAWLLSLSSSAYLLSWKQVFCSAFPVLSGSLGHNTPEGPAIWVSSVPEQVSCPMDSPMFRPRTSSWPPNLSLSKYYFFGPTQILLSFSFSFLPLTFLSPMFFIHVFYSRALLLNTNIMVTTF